MLSICHQFLNISYWSNSEYWSQKRTQSGNIHSTELDVYAVYFYSDKLAHVQVVINCRYSVAQMRTHEDPLIHNLGALCIDDVMS